jgi:hypothetical protein
MERKAIKFSNQLHRFKSGRDKIIYHVSKFGSDQEIYNKALASQIRVQIRALLGERILPRRTNQTFNNMHR